MAASTKFDVSSSSPDRQLYTPRGSYLSASLDRLGSFRENVEHPTLSSLPSLSRGTCSSTSQDVVSFLQCLRFDLKSMAVDHKFNRQTEFKRIANAAFGLPPDGSPAGALKGKLPSPSLDDLKRLKAVVRVSSIKARERIKIFTDVLSVMNKCFPSITSRKRSRSDVLTSDRSNAFLSSDRSVLSKMGAQSHASTSGFELESQRSEERTKLPIPNKRTRTSMVDIKNEVRPNTPARPSGNTDKDKETLRSSNSGAALGEDRSLSVGIDGWEKSKMKKKRSGIKPDVTPSTGTTKANDGYREPMQGVPPQKLVAEARSRVNDPHGSRLGVSNAVIGVGKIECATQPSGTSIRSSIPRSDQDNSSLLHDRRERPSSLNKEKMNFRAVSKATSRDDFNSTSPTSNKINHSARAPRSVSNVVPKLSQVVQRASISDDWEVSQGTNKLPVITGVNHHKRMPSARSSSPPVASWAGQRPQKISRMARRSNLVPVLSNTEDHSAMDAAINMTASETVSSHSRHSLGNSPQQVKGKADYTSSAALSESEESGAAETKYREKGKKSDEMDEKVFQSAQNPPLLLPPRKNKLVSGDDLGDGVRRHGRPGRGNTSTRSPMPMTTGKLGKVGIAKQLRSTRLGMDKSESKAGRPPTRKLSDRRAYTRQKHSTINASADFLVGSDDGNEELLAAAAVSNPVNCFSSSFWRQMEPFFSLISDADVAYVKQQGGFESAAPTPTPLSLEINISNAAPSYGFMDNIREINELRSSNLPGNLDLGTSSSKEAPLYQRLIAALISEEDYILSDQNGDLESDVCGFSSDMGTELASNSFNNLSRGKFQVAGQAGYNSYAEIQNKSSHTENVLQVRNNYTGVTSDFDSAQNGLISDQTLEPHMTCSETQYDQMSLDERVLLELQSIGVCAEYPAGLAQSGDEKISEDIRILVDKYHEQVSKKKDLLVRLHTKAFETRECQIKDFEQRAIEKLVTMAYEKYMSCRSTKNASSKMAKQAALSFINRVLDRCQQYEHTGKSCFNEPIYREMFLCGSYLNHALPDTAADGETSKQCVSTPGCSLEVRVSGGPCSTQPSPSSLNNHDIYSSSDAIQPKQHVNEETWSTRIKKRELFLDDVGGSMGGIVSSLSSSAKGKRSERDREGNVNINRGGEALSRNGTSRIGSSSKPASSGNSKGEQQQQQRKTKTKPKQKSTSTAPPTVNGPPSSSSSKMNNLGTTTGDILDDFNLDVLNDLPIPEMDILGGVPDDLGGQGQDFASWLNIDDDALQDHDNYMGLEIPMDDLADLNMI